MSSEIQFCHFSQLCHGNKDPVCQVLEPMEHVTPQMSAPTWVELLLGHVPVDLECAVWSL